MSPSHTRKSSGRLYRYYVSQTAMKQGHAEHSMPMVPAGEIEQIVLDQIRRLLQTPEVVVHSRLHSGHSLKLLLGRSQGPAPPPLD